MSTFSIPRAKLTLAESAHLSPDLENAKRNKKIAETNPSNT
jgi:hypothetical protein